MTVGEALRRLHEEGKRGPVQAAEGQTTDGDQRERRTAAEDARQAYGVMVNAAHPHEEH